MRLGIIIVNESLTTPRFGRGLQQDVAYDLERPPQPNARSRAYSDRRSFIWRRVRRKQPTSNLAPVWCWARRNLLVNRFFRVLLRRQVIWAQNRRW
jgi:hypothetical protein